MIAFVRGQVAHVASDQVIIEAMGVGYRIYTHNSRGQLPVVGQQAKYFTYMSVREDAMQLFGFLSIEEYQLFLQLIAISGIGPKVAMGLLGAVTPSAFSQAIRQKELSMLTRIPGIGKKTAERLIVELKDKLGQFADEDDDASFALPVRNADEAAEALMALGYSAQEAGGAVRLARKQKPEAAVEEIIKLALKEAMKPR